MVDCSEYISETDTGMCQGTVCSAGVTGILLSLSATARLTAVHQPKYLTSNETEQRKKTPMSGFNLSAMFTDCKAAVHHLL